MEQLIVLPKYEAFIETKLIRKVIVSITGIVLCFLIAFLYAAINVYNPLVYFTIVALIIASSSVLVSYKILSKILKITDARFIRISSYVSIGVFLYFSWVIFGVLQFEPVVAY